MNIKNLKNLIATLVIAIIAILATSQMVDAQGNKNERKQQKKIEKQQRKAWQNQAKNEDRRIKAAQRAEQTRLRNLPYRNVNVDNDRWRVNRNGSYYETNNRGAEMLRQAVNAGYQEGYRAGRDDRNYRRSDNYRNSSVYRRGNYGDRNYVNSNQYQYYFQQGFQRGYEDGYNSRYEYGTNNNGSLNILGVILQNILGLERY